MRTAHLGSGLVRPVRGEFLFSVACTFVPAGCLFAFFIFDLGARLWAAGVEVSI
jgi:hypothetical protein